MSGKDRFDELRNRIDELKLSRSRAETTVSMMEAERERIVTEIKSMGVDPKNIDQEIETRKATLESYEKEVIKVLDSVKAVLSGVGGENVF